MGAGVNGANATTKKGQECIWRCVSMFIHGGDSEPDKKENEKGKRREREEREETDETIHGVGGCR